MSDYYEFDQDNPRVAVLVDERIAQQIDVLIDPEFGRPGRVNDTRIISKTPYLVAYRVLGRCNRNSSCVAQQSRQSSM
ncbi:hypothetical protein LJR084_007840 [Variovorax sp. LjRoot84]|uniref:hypothetical protein n=1 Tax=Variovorax sp. LjRoot84 TaxID=3342340 RepID=UPI003ECE136B